MKRHSFFSLVLCLCLLLLASCHGGKKSGAAQADMAGTPIDSTSALAPAYAKGYALRRLAGGITLVDIKDPQSATATAYRFALVTDSSDRTEVPEGYAPVRVPVRSVVCMTSLQLSNFIALDACGFVSGITSTRHLFDPEMNRRLEEGKTLRIGIEGNFDNEVILAISPDVIFISPYKRGGYETLRETGIPLVPHLGYKETSPLGQAEWIKLIGAFTGMERQAAERFAAIEKRYNSLKELTARVEYRPVVFSGEMRGGNWYAVGGQSFLAQLFRDAGADYFLKDDTHSGGVTLDFESVYSRAESADYWRIVNSYNGTFSYEALRASDERYADFRAFRRRQVLYCNMKQTPFYESMPMEPDAVLADLIHAFHPELLPEHSPVYYSLLKE